MYSNKLNENLKLKDIETKVRRRKMFLRNI